MKTITRRNFLKASALTLGGAMLAGCATPTPSPAAPTEAPKEQPMEAPAAATEAPKEQPTEAPPAQAGRPAVKGQVWCFWQGFIDYYVESAKEYAAKYNPNFELGPGLWGWDVYWDKLSVALQTKVEAPLYAEAIPLTFSRYIVDGECLFADITDAFKNSPLYDGFVMSKLDAYTWKGKIYGLEHDIAPAIMLYREDIWKDAGIDIEKIDLWDDFIQAGLDLKKKKPDTFAMPILSDLDVYLMQKTGQGYFDKDGNCLIDSPASIEVMKWLISLFSEHKIADLAPGGEAFWAEMQKNKYAAVYGFSWNVGQFKGNLADQKGKWKMKVLPAFEKGGRRTSTLGGEILGTVPGVADLGELWKFQEFARYERKEGYLDFMMTYGNIPPYKPFMEEPRFKDNVDDYVNQRLYDIYIQIIDEVPSPYPSPYLPKLQEMLGADYRAMLEGQKAPEDVLKKIGDEIRKLQAEDA